jgi:diguanylate cyclase (GGDEF)-like protein
MAGGYGTEVTGQIRSLLARMQAEEDRLLVERNQKVADARGLALAVGVGGVLLSLIIIGLVFSLVRREGMRRLGLEADLSGANGQLSSSLQQAERLIQEKRMIDRVAGLLHSCSSLEDAREIISKEIRQALPDLRGAVYLFRASRNLVEVISHWNEPNTIVSGKSFSPDECWALKSGSRHVMRTPNDVACGHVDSRITEAAVCVPMNIHGESIGVMVVEGTTEQFDDARLDLIRRLVEQIGMSLATLRLQQQLREQSFRDPLTGLFNRRYLEATMEKDVSRADRHRHAIGLVMIDIDHFKSINDQYGHEAGDLVLKSASDILRKHTRTEDIACRYGGEEFLLVLSGASLNTTCERAETVRLAVEKLVVVLPDGRPVTGTTISLGVAIYPTHGVSWQAVLGIADQALYRAKDQGRNRVVVAEAVLSAAVMET